MWAGPAKGGSLGMPDLCVCVCVCMLIMIEVGPGFEYPLPLLHSGQVYAALGVD